MVCLACLQQAGRIKYEGAFLLHESPVSFCMTFVEGSFFKKLEILLSADFLSSTGTPRVPGLKRDGAAADRVMSEEER